jgi:hypothetical protein
MLSSINQDWDNLSWENVAKCEAGLGAIIIFALLYLGFMPCALAMDRRRNMRFKRNFIHEVDETFAMAELGSVVVTFADLLDAANFGAKKLHLVNQNAQQRSKWRLLWENISSARFWCHPCNKKKKAFVMVSAEVGRGESEGLIACTFEVGSLIRTDWATKSDPVVCALLFDDASQVYLPSHLTLAAMHPSLRPTLRFYAFHGYIDSQDFVPYARTELIIDSQSHKYQRRLVFRIPRDLSRQLMILVSCMHVHGRNYQCTQPLDFWLGDG